MILNDMTDSSSKIICSEKSALEKCRKQRLGQKQRNSFQAAPIIQLLCRNIVVPVNARILF